MKNQNQILNKVLKAAGACIANGGTFKAIFDLDSTLFDVNPRIHKILHDFGSDVAVQKHFPEAAQILSKNFQLKQTYKLKEQVIHLGLHTQKAEFYPLLLEYWKTHFFSNEYLKYDAPYEGAIEFVQEIYNLGATVYYLTGRDVARMGIGTEEQLNQWNLPLGSRAHLALKPDKEMDDAEFKRDFLLKLPREKVEVWFFENEPANIELVLHEVNHVKVVYFESVHSEKAEPPGEHIPRIKNFKTGPHDC